TAIICTALCSAASGAGGAVLRRPGNTYCQGAGARFGRHAQRGNQSHPEQFRLARAILLLFHGLTEAVQEVERSRAKTFLDEFRVTVRSRRFSGKAKRALRLGQKPLRVSRVTEFGLGHAMNEWMRLQTVRLHAHLVTSETSRARTDERVEHSKLAALSFGQQPLNPLRRTARAVTKPPVY